MIPLQITNFGVFFLSFSLGAFTHNWLNAAGYTLLLLHGVFWASDFTGGLGVTDVWFNVWTSGVAIAAGVAGHLYAKAMQCPQLILPSTLRSRRERVAIPLEDIFVFLFIFSTLLVAAGINLWLGRTIVGGGGLSPINTDLVTAGISLTIAFGILLVIMSIGLAALGYDARVTLKYAWLVMLPPMSLLLNDLAYYDWGWSDPWPPLVTLLLMIGLFALVWFLSYKLPVFRLRTREEVDGEEVTVNPANYDPMYKNRMYALVFFGGQAGVHTVGLLLLSIIAAWPEHSLETGAIVMLGWAGAVIVVDLIIGYAAADGLASMRRVQLSEEGELKEAFRGSRLESAPSTGRAKPYQRVRSEHSEGQSLSATFRQLSQ